MEEATFKDWRRLDETEAFFAYLEQEAISEMNAWAAGQFTGESAEATIQKNAESIGKVQFIGHLMTLEADDVPDA